MESLAKQGFMQEYRQKTGSFYSMESIVIGGEKRGRMLGFPTANIKASDKILPPLGIYAVIAEIGGKKHKGVANIGYAPTFNRNKLVVEVHILGFSQDIYGKGMKVHFVQKIRDEKKFHGMQELIEQIRKDCGEARRILKDL